MPNCGDRARVNRILIAARVGNLEEKSSNGPNPIEISDVCACRQDDREWSVTAKPQMDGSIDHSPWQITISLLYCLSGF
jgi:hypothetical protein